MERRRHVELDLRHQVSPFTVYRRLADGQELVLVDLRPGGPHRPPALGKALARPGPGWTPPADVDVVVFDQDGQEALAVAQALQAAGHPRVRALFGGLDLWDLALGGFE